MVINGDCLEVLKDLIPKVKNPVIVTDPPFNIGYHYNGYKDRLRKEEYLNMIFEIMSYAPSVIIHYPEDICDISIKFGTPPIKSYLGFITQIRQNNTEI